jgi:hypothetical protein
MLLAFAMSHGNPAYMIFLYPFLIVASLSAIQIERNWRFVVAAVLFYFLTPYAVLAYLNRGKGYSTTDIHQVSDTIQQIARDRGVEAAKLRVYGDYSLWFAHPGNYRAASFSTADKIQDADLYLCFDRSFDIAALQPLNMFYCQDILARVLVHPIRAMEVHGNKLYFYVR